VVMPTCSVPGCHEPCAALALRHCRTHQRLVADFHKWLYGDGRDATRSFDADRFWLSLERTRPRQK
jgi:hypothetical protein